MISVRAATSLTGGSSISTSTFKRRWWDSVVGSAVLVTGVLNIVKTVKLVMVVLRDDRLAWYYRYLLI